MSKLIVNVQTGEELLMELSDEDKKQQKADEKALNDELKAYAKSRTEQDAAKAALLARLGLTEDELKTILG
jgi:hypothetical protein